MAPYNREAAIAAQKKYCEDNEVPHFAPSDGYCYHCGRNIYDLYISTTISRECGIGESGITVEQAGKRLITGCPHCHYSFVE